MKKLFVVLMPDYIASNIFSTYNPSFNFDAIKITIVEKNQLGILIVGRLSICIGGRT
jgi:hypothetical protein